MTESDTPKTEERGSKNFIEQIIEEDLRSGKYDGRVLTRFPPEPNGYLHIGHAKAIVLNFEIAKKYGGKTNLRFDDTNPLTEDPKYIQAIKEDIRWLGYDWEDREYYASDYFPILYEYALKLIKKGKAYVDHSSQEEINRMRGTPDKPGEESPYRNRSVEENLALFEQMRSGAFKEGECVLRAKIDMRSPNMHMRDPVMYRIIYHPHHRTGTKWCIYPTYDFAHGQSDSIERITHSLCTLEFEHHRPLYDWFIRELEIFPSRQIEFARLNLNYTVMSKRLLLRLVNEGHVSGWDDPRLPTLRGMRRRGYTPEAIKSFIHKVGIAKRDNIIDISLLEHEVREDLDRRALRRMVVFDPIEVELVNYEEGKSEELPAANHPKDESRGIRMLPFSKYLYIDRDDFMIDPPKGYHRLRPDGYVRLKHAYIIRCVDYEIDEHSGKVCKIYAEYIPESKSGQDRSGIKTKGVIHWVDAPSSAEVELRLYDRLFSVEDPLADKSRDFTEFLNPNSLRIIPHARAERSLADVEPETHFQFLRKGFFVADPDSTKGKPVFNRTVELRDSWAKKRGGK